RTHHQLCTIVRQHAHSICNRSQETAPATNKLPDPEAVCGRTVHLPMIELLTTTEMARADAIAVERGTDSFVLMQRAGAAVAEAAMAMAPEGPILVVAGRGNNGGDGFVAAVELAGRGRDVSLMLLCDPKTLQGDAARAAKLWRGAIGACDPDAIGKPALIIDALLGA